MRNVLLLTKLGLLSSLGSGRAKKRRLGQNAMRALNVLGGLLLMLFMGVYGWGISLLAEEAGAPRMLLSIGVLLGSLLSVVFGIAKTPSLLFAAKDLEMLLSLPVKEREVFLSRLILVWTSHLTGMATVTLPFFAVYGIRFGTAGFFLRMVPVLLLLPFVLAVVGSLCALLITGISRHFKKSGAVSMVLTLLLIGAILCGSMFLGAVTGSDMVSAIQNADRALMNFPLTGWSVQALLGSTWGFLKLTALCLVPFAAVALLFSKTFRRIHAALNERRSEGNFRLGAMKTASPLKALAKREIKSYFSQNYYVFNTAVGGVMLLILSVLLLIGGPAVLSEIAEVEGGAQVKALLFPLLVLMECFCVTVGCTTASSISLEGNRLWILKSLPVSVRDIYRAKLAVQLLITLPVLPISGIIGAAVLGLGITGAVILILLPALCALFIGLVGLIANLLFPMLDWKNPAVPVKKGGSVLVAMLVAFALMAVFALLWWKLQMDFIIFSAFAAAVLVILCVLAWKWLCSRGAKRFLSL